MKALVFAVLLSAVLLSGCSALSPQPLGNDIQFSTITKGDGIQLSYTGEANLVIKSPGEWIANIGQRLPPTLNFSNEVVIAALYGEKPHGGYNMDITSIRRVGGNTVVFVNRVAPGPTCFNNQSATWPYDIIKINRTYAVNIIFQNNDSVKNC